METLHERDGDIDRPELAVGARVRVIRDPDWNGPWPDEPVGTIELADRRRAYITTESKWGPIRQFKVRFDNAQRNADGDGPYSSALIWQQYLVPVSGPSE